MSDLTLAPFAVEELRAGLDASVRASRPAAGDVPDVPDVPDRLSLLARLACEADEPEHALTLITPDARGLLWEDASESGLPAGFVLWGPVTADTRAWLAAQGLAADFEVLLIAVAADRRRRGIGRKLLEAALASEPAGARWVLGTGNAPSTERFYRASAWEPVGLEPGYFERAYGHAVFEGDVPLTARTYFRRTTPQA